MDIKEKLREHLVLIVAMVSGILYAHCCQYAMISIEQSHFAFGVLAFLIFTLKLMDLAVFAGLFLVGSFIAGYLDAFVSGFLGGFGIIGTVIAYVVVLVPLYYLLDRFWRRRR